MALERTKPETPPHLALWGKASDAKQGCHYHPLAYHCLDVAAVAEVLIAEDRRLTHHARRLGVDGNSLGRLVVLLVALHDIGKASRSFQSKRKDLWCAEILGAWRDDQPETPGHGTVTGYYLSDRPLGAWIEDLLPDWGGGRPALINAVAGHHGRPVEDFSIPGERSLVVGGSAVVEVVRQMAEEMRDAIGAVPIALPVEAGDTALHAFAWYVAALLPAADWLGSNAAEQYGYHPPTLPLAGYWSDVARLRATRAVAANGLDQAPPSQADAKDLLSGLPSLSPLQHWAAGTPLPERGPMLAVIEDATGAGKTEAALLLVHRLMRAGLAGGFYMALPTMATADAMYGRLEPIYNALFEHEARPSLALAHGQARRHPGFRSLIHRKVTDGGSVAAYCSGWIAHDRRLAFLAQAGAGTIDQAVLTVLPSKYQTLRLFGLTDKVLVIDEAHSFDSYLSEETEALLRFQAAQGGSALILSATLPRTTRARFLRAFAEGAGLPPPQPSASAYPLASTLSRDGFAETPLAIRPGTEREVKVARIDSIEEAEELALDAARDAAAVAVIRTTVDSAIETYERLAAVNGDEVRVLLFHARFLYADRKRIEEEVLRRFGLRSAGTDRQATILVATQVIEQSLDIDFDVMISDLAPVDLLIQRVGRLWRHRKWDEIRPLSAPVLHVLSPEPTNDAGKDWLDTILPEARWVYKDPNLLHLSAHAVLEARRIVASTRDEAAATPDHIRDLVETVYKKFAGPISPELIDEAERAEGAAMADRAIARFQLLNWRAPYEYAGQPWADDVKVSTRLDDGSRIVRLAREEGGRLVPLVSDNGAAPDWSMNELRLRPSLHRKLRPPTPSELARFYPPWKEADEGTLVLLMAREGEEWVATADNSKPLSYSSVLGLRRRPPDSS